MTDIQDYKANKLSEKYLRECNKIDIMAKVKKSMELEKFIDGLERLYGKL